MAAPANTTVDLSAALVTAPVQADHWLVILPVGLCIALGAILMMLRDRTAMHGWIAIPGLTLLVLDRKSVV